MSSLSGEIDSPFPARERREEKRERTAPGESDYWLNLNESSRPFFRALPRTCDLFVN